MSGRIERRFAELKAEGRSGLVTFLCGGDPDPETSYEILAFLYFCLVHRRDSSVG